MALSLSLKSRSRPDLQAWWAQRARREKLLLAFGLVAAIVLIGDSLIIQPLEKKIRQAQAQHDTLSSRWQQGAKQGQVQRAAQAQAQQQEAQLRARLQAAQARVGALNAKLQDTAQLPQLLRAITATVGAARLLELQVADDPNAASAGTVAPGQPVAAAASTAAIATKNTEVAASSTVVAAPRRMYRLPLTLKVSGSWAELHQLLTQIERHADGLQWTHLMLDSSGWPAIELTLKAHVLSLQPRWGGGA